MIKATVTFHNKCIEADTAQARGMADISKQIASGTHKDTTIAILDLTSERTRRISNDTAQKFHTAFKENLMGRVSLEHLPTLVASAHGMLMMFQTSVWHLAVDESVWPSRMRSAGFCKMTPIVKQIFATIPALCGLVVPPQLPEMPAPPPLPVLSFLQ